MLDGASFCRLVVADIATLLGGGGESPVKLSAAAKASGYSRDHLRRMIREGKLRSYRRGRVHLVRLSDLPMRPGGAPPAGPSERALPPAAPAPDTSNGAVRVTVTEPAVDHPAGSANTNARALDVLAPSAYDPAADARQAMAAIRGRGGKG
jgi:excisionase family DNA binding protein